MREDQATESNSTTGRAKPYNAEVVLYGVYEISKVLAQPLRIEVTLGQVLHVLSNFLDMRHALIVLLGPDESREATIFGGDLADDDAAQAYVAALPEQVIGQVVVSQAPVVVSDVRKDEHFSGSSLAHDAQGAQVAFIAVPVRDRGQVVGVLSIDRDIPSGESADRYRLDDDVRFLMMVANLVGPVVRFQRIIANDRERMLREQHRLAKALRHHAPLGDSARARVAGIVGDSPEIQAVLSKARVVARSQSTVLLRGESGTGKELFAKAIHDMSPRSGQPFVTLNCAALPESVLESELFGHERGAFTGAQGQRKGRFELADGGTLFLDEIGEISPQFQAKLLRVLQIGEFERVGGTVTLKVNVRIVAATNRNLEEAVARGEFRADLYYRISVVPIMLPPLRERSSDIPLLAQAFLQRFNDQNERQLDLEPQSLELLRSCAFPGNVRELENCIYRTATLAHGPTIGAEDFACSHDECLSASLWQRPSSAAQEYMDLIPVDTLREGRGTRSRPPSVPGAPGVGEAAGRLDDATGSDDDEGLDEMDAGERERLIAVLGSVGWVQAKAARVLGLTPRQVGYAIRKYRIPIKKF